MAIRGSRCLFPPMQCRCCSCLLLPVSLPPTAAATGRTAAALADPAVAAAGLPLLSRLLQFLLTLLPLTLLLLLLLLPLRAAANALAAANDLDAVIVVVALAVVATTVRVVVHSAAGTVGAADAVCAVVALMLLPPFH